MALTRGLGLTVMIAVGTSLVTAAFAVAAFGGLTQPDGAAGCIADDGAPESCADARLLDRPNSLTFSSDGEFAYATVLNVDAVMTFDRDPTTGALAHLPGTAGCISQTGSGGECLDGRGLDNPNWIELSPDGRFAYVASLASDSIAIFSRDPMTGALSQLADPNGCVAEVGDGATCLDAHAINGVRTLALSPDGEYLYATALNSDAVSVFDVNTQTGTIAQLPDPNGCVAEAGDGISCVDGRALDTATGLAVAPDGAGPSIYVASGGTSDGVAVFDRGIGSGRLTQLSGSAGCVTLSGGDGCATGRGTGEPITAAVDPAGETLYLASEVSDAITTFDRDRSSGRLNQLAGAAGCVSDTGSADCADGTGLNGVAGVTVSPDGRNVYGVATVLGTVSIFDRDPTSGMLSQQSGTAGCIADAGDGVNCADGRALGGALFDKVSPDGKHLYVAAPGDDAISIFAREPAATNPPGTDPPDQITCNGEVATLVGTDEAETIRGTSGDDVIAALRGPDVVTGRGGDDLVCGGKGQDDLAGGRGNDRLRGGAGEDFCDGGRGTDKAKSCQQTVRVP